MKTIGLLGGMSWESSLEYYRCINQDIKKRLGGLHSAKCLLYSVDFQEVETLQQTDQWEKAGQVLGKAACSLQKGGADFLLICTNTMHKVAASIKQQIDIPLLHIADPTAESVLKQGMRKIALLGTRFTMQEDFYKGILINDHGLQVIIPSQEEMQRVDQIIFEELCLGIIREESKQHYLTTIERLASAGAEGVILGCTEIGLLVKEEDSPIPVFDTTLIHAEAAVNFALQS